MDDNEESDCKFYEASCKVSEMIADGANNIVVEIVASWADWTMNIVEFLSTFWFEVPTVDVTESPAIAGIQYNLGWYTALFAVIGMMIGIAKIVMSNDIRQGIGLIKPLLTVVVVAVTYTAAVNYLLMAGDEFSPWIIDQVPEASADGIAGIVTVGPQLGSTNVGVFLILYLLLLIASFVNIAFVLMRSFFLMILLSVIVVIAASSGTESGGQAFKKANGYLLALILFKPVAAVIYAIGLWVVSNPGSVAGDGVSPDLEIILNTLTGLLILACAALALPALVKFIVPVAAQGSAAFSGGAAVGAVATVAAGAAVIGATGGAGAGAGAGASAPQSGSAAAQTGGQSGGSSVAPGAGGKPPGDSGGAAANGAKESGSSSETSSGGKSASGASSPEKESVSASSAPGGASPSQAGAGQDAQAPAGAPATSTGGAAPSAPSSNDSSWLGAASSLSASGADPVNNNDEDQR